MTGAKRHMGKGRASGELGWTRESDVEGKHPEEELIRCCDGFVSLSLIQSPHLCLFPFFSVSLFCGVPPAAAKKKKNIVRLHSSSPLLNSVVVTLDDKGVKRKSPSHYILFLFYFVFLFTVVYLGIWLFFFFFIASNTSSSSLHFFFLFQCLYLVFPYDVEGEGWWKGLMWLV